MNPSMQIIAHRGASFDCPENTLDAFTQAIAKGSKCVETDVRVCADGSLILCHEPIIKAHQGPDICIAEHGLAHLRANAKDGEALLELDDLLTLLGQAQCHLHLEIKPGPLQVDIVDEATTKMRRAGVHGVVSSFDPLIVARAGPSGIPTLLLMDNLPLDTARRARACGASAVGIDIRALKGQKAITIASKIPTYSFTVNAMDQLRKCIEFGLEGVYSDHPDLLSILLEKSNEQCQGDGKSSNQSKRDRALLDKAAAGRMTP